MKKFLDLSVTLILFLSLNLGVFAQISKRSGLQKNISSFANSSGESVSFGKIEAYSDGNGVLIKWQTESEYENLGFDIYRASGKDSIKANQHLVEGTYLRGELDAKQGGTYSFFDPEGTSISVYRIKNVSISGRNRSSNDIYPQLENDLKRVGGASSTEFQKGVRESNPVTVKKAPVLPEELKRQAIANESLTNLVNQQWVASQPGVKLGVKSTGVYRVLRAELQAGGFDVNSSPSLWQLYLNGIEQAINVESNGDYIEFYGKGIDTPESETNIYFLIVGSQAGKRMGTTIRRPIGGRVVGKNFDYSLEQKERALYASTLLNGDTENFFGGIITSTTVGIVNFDLDGIDFSAGKASVDIAVQGLTFTPHTIEVKVNGTSLETMTGSNRNLFSISIGIPVSLLQNGTNTIELQSTLLGDVSLASSIKVNFKRLYKANQNELGFYTRNLRTTTVTGFTSQNIRVFDITYPDAPTLISNAVVEPTDKLGAEYSVYLPAHRRRNMYAFEDTALKQIESVSQNFPSTLSTTTNDADLVIITHRDWLTEANAWATYRQNDGLTVAVVDVEDAYDEFGFGVTGSAAIREFLNYAVGNWQTAPSYVLFLGDASYDPKNYTGEGFHNYVPVRMVDTLYEETGSDEAIADFNDDGSTELGVGRIPARVPQDVTNALNKVMTFEAGLATAPGRGSLCASDFPQGYDFAGLCNRVQNELPPSIPTMAINRGDPNAKNALIAAINSGKYIVNYSGHGSTGSWASTTFFGSGDVPQLTNSPDLSIFTMLTCLNGYFIRPVDDSLSEHILKKVDGGGVAVWSSSGSTTPDVQEVMAKRFFNQMGNNDDMIRIGDIIKDAKSVLIGGRDVKRSWVLLGDPTLKVK